MARVEQRRRARTIVLALVATVAAACGGGAPPPELPVPPRDVEKPVAEHLAAATAAVRDDPRSAAAWGRLGEVYQANDLEEPALACYERAAELGPGEWRWAYLAGLLSRGRDPAAALAYLTRAAEIRPDDAPLQFHVGFAHYLDENLDAAERHYRRALELDPTWVNARLGLARVAVARGDPAAALADLEPALPAAANEGALHLHLAQVYRELGRDADAEREERETATSPNPARGDGMAALVDPVLDELRLREGVSSAREIERGASLLAAGKDSEALAAVERALAAAPDSVPALVAASRVLAGRGELDAALARAERAIALAPESAEAYAELGTVHAMAGRIGPAIDALRRAIEIDPKPPRVKSNLAGLLVQAGRLEEALALLADASRDHPDDVDLRQKTALVLERYRAGAAR